MHAWEINMIYHDRVILIFPSVSEVYENIAQVQSINHWGNRLIFRWVRQMSAITIFTTKIFDKNRRKKNIGERTSCFTKENYIYIYIYIWWKKIYVVFHAVSAKGSLVGEITIISVWPPSAATVDSCLIRSFEAQWLMSHPI